MVIILYGVSGCGKTTIGQLLGENLAIPFYDADDYHPKSNIEKMKSGIPLNDLDRQPWLQSLSSLIGEGSCILACSALKEKYRQTLSQGSKDIHWVLLEGSFEIVLERIKARKSHFMKAELLQSQFDILEKANYGLQLNILENPKQIIKTIIDKIKIENLMSKTSFGVIGLGVMGKSISLNIAEKGHTLSVYNRAVEGEENIVSNFIDDCEFDSVEGYTNLTDFVNSMSTPRKILMMITAGPVVDNVLKERKL